MENFKSQFDAILIKKLGVDQNDITPKAKFLDHLGADSLDMVELIIEFENVFKISIPDDDMENIKTVGDAENYLQGKLKLK